MTSNSDYTILIADDESSIIEGLSALLIEEDYKTKTARDGDGALTLLKEETIPLALVDLNMPGRTGLEILKEVKSQNISTEVIIITGQGTIDTAVEAMKEGAYDYLTKPVQPKRLRSIVPKALERYELVANNRNLAEKNQSLSAENEKLELALEKLSKMIGEHDTMVQVNEIIDAVADTTASVLITGESGTGKELVAQAIHNKSSRNKSPFIAVNCSAFPRDLLESELFGHEKGAFTGAVKEKAGCFEMADNGTLFLDEIGEMPADTQAKLLRVLEEKNFRRLGGMKEISVDVRVVAATNRDIKAALDDGTLREDLYFRLSVMDVELPPLRDRISDLPLIANEFINNFNNKNNKQVKGFSDECLDILKKYHWPGNVRELRNLIERAVILCKGDTIAVEHLPKHIFYLNENSGEGDSIQLGKPLEEIEKEVIYKTLEMTNNNKTKAAQVLGISLKTMHNKLNKYFLDEGAE